MGHPQIVVYEGDGWLAAQVTPLAREHDWVVRESRHAHACLTFLTDARTAVLLLKLNRDLHDELSLLATVYERVPDCPVIVMSDAKMEGNAERTALAGLAYDLGARYVLFPPLMRPIIEDLVVGFMETSIKRYA